MIEKIIILTDLEGIIGVTEIENDCLNKALLIEELKSIIIVLNSINIHKVDVCFVHNGGQLLEGCELKEYGCKIYRDLLDIKEIGDYDTAIMNGFHGKNGSGGNFDHSFRFDIREVKWNDHVVGEIEIYASWLKKKNVPVIFLSGEFACEEEVRNIRCGFFSTSRKNSALDEVRVRDDLCKALISEVQRENKSIDFDFYDGEVRIKFISLDLADRLKCKGYYVIEDSVIFKDVEEFILCEKVFFDDIFEAYKEIMIYNTQFSTILKEHKEEISILPLNIQNIFLKPLEFVDKVDRELICEYLNIDNDF